jgi:hypothetical protein
MSRLIFAAIAVLGIMATSSLARAQPQVIIAGGCSPTDVRSNEAVLIRCQLQVSNQGDAAVPEARLIIGPGGTGGPIPRFFILGTAPARYSAPVSELGTLNPGEVKDVSFRIIVKAEASFGTSATVIEDAKGPQWAEAPGELVVRPDAPAPGRDLRVTLELDAPVSWDLEDNLPPASIVIRVRNGSTQAIRHILLRDEHFTNTTISWQDRPARTDQAAFEWDIPLLGPGEETVLRGQIDTAGAGLESEHGIVATGALPDGTQVEGVDLGHWTHAFCQSETVHCAPPPTPTSTPNATEALPEAAPTFDDYAPPETDGGGPRWLWIVVLGAGIPALVVGAIVARRTLK